MVTATVGQYSPPENIAGPIKRPAKQQQQHGTPFPAAKKHRSHDGAAAAAAVPAAAAFIDDYNMKRSFVAEKGGGHYAPSQASPAQLIKLEHNEFPLGGGSNGPSSPGGGPPRKSSLKTSSGTTTPTMLVESPSEGDKKGMYSDFVQGALDDRARGRDRSYQELVGQFRPPTSKSPSSSHSTSLLQMLLHSLSNVASRLDKRNHTPLVDNILTLPWATMGGDSFARTWMRFICTLCSARNEWIGDVLSRAVKGLSYRSDWRSLAYLPPGGPSSSRPTRRAIFSRIHTLLRSLLALIPTLPTQLGPLILRHFPHKREGIKEHVVYIRNIFELCEYADELRPMVLECVMGRSVEIDVEIQMDLDELEDAEADLDDDSVENDEEGREVERYLDLFDQPIDDDEFSDDDTGDDESEDMGFDDILSDDDDDAERSNRAGKGDLEKVTQIRKLVNKLDAIMETTFSQLESKDTRYLRACKGLDLVDSALTPARAIALRNDQFSDLMSIFTKMLLPTFKSRHVQFVLFWFSSLDQDYSDLFLGLLLSKAIYGTARSSEEEAQGVPNGSSEDVPMIVRVASASYVASLVSRAKYIDKKDVRTVMRNLCAFLEAHLDAFGSGWLVSEAHMQRMDDNTVVGPHSLFYAVSQACFYIFCFRWRDLQLKAGGGAEGEDDNEEEEGETSEADEVISGREKSATSKWCEGLEVIKRAIMSNLNPLANCSPAVAEQFAGVAQLTGFLYCWSLIERNSRTTAATSRPNSNRSSVNTSVARSDSRDTIVTPVEGPGHLKSSSVSSTTYAATRRELDSFFPFDPYRLRGSTKWVEPLYREWSDVAPQGMMDDDDDDEEDEDDVEEEEEVDSEASSDNDDVDDHHHHRSSRVTGRNALKIPKTKGRSSRRREGFAPSSSSTNEDQIAKSLNSLEAMSISPMRSKIR